MFFTMSYSRRVHSISLQIYVLFLFLQSFWPVFFIIFASKVQIVFAKSISKFVDLEKRQISPRMHYLWTDNTILPQYCTTCAQIVQRLPQYCTACGHLIQSRRNIALPMYTWYNLVAILHCLWTLGTISSQYCTTCVHLIPSPSQDGTACAHLIPSRRKMVPLVYK